MYIKSGLDGIFVMGGTTHPDMIDPAVFRNGDFDRGLYVGSMDDRQIAEIPRAVSTKRISKLYTKLFVGFFSHINIH